MHGKNPVFFVCQVNRFLHTYSSMAKDIPADSLSDLQTVFSQLSSQYLSSVSIGAPPPRELTASMQAYLSSVRETCRASWARFNPLKMAAGLLVLTLACVVCYVLSEMSLMILQGCLLKAPVLSGLMVGGVVATGQLFTLGFLEVSWCLGAAALMSEVTFLWRIRRSFTCGG